jgi:hypothetical protein
MQVMTKQGVLRVMHALDRAGRNDQGPPSRSHLPSKFLL